MQLCRSSQLLPSLTSLLLAPGRYPSLLPRRTSLGMQRGLVGGTWPAWGRKPSSSPSMVPATCQPRGRAKCHGRTLSCEYPASTEGENGDRGDKVKGFRSCHPVINSLQAPGSRETSLAAIRRSIASMGYSVRGEEQGVLPEMGKAGDRALELAGASGRKHS